MANNNNNNKNEEWIGQVLVPTLVSDGKFSLLASDPSTETTIKSIEIYKLSLKEAFMMNLCYKIKITLTNGELTSDYGIVAKITPEVNNTPKTMDHLKILFKNEVMAYLNILPLIGIAKNCPKYYYSDINDNESARIVLSDFTWDGWKMSPTLVNLSLEHILISVSQLGKFHGACYATKSSNRKYFNGIINQFEESRFYAKDLQNDLPYDRRLRAGPKRSILAVRNSIELRSKIPDEFLNKLSTQLEDVYNYQKIKVKPIEPFAVICHGDFLRNNIAYKYDSTDQPTEAMMFDFQTLRYASPMIDLTTFMANSTGVAVRREHFDEIFHNYYSAVVKEYIKGIDGCNTGGDDQVPEFLSYDSLLKEYVRYLPFGFSIASSFIPMLHVPFDEAFIPSMDPDEDLRDCMERGGESVNRELCAMVEDIYDFYLKYNVELD